MADESTSSDAGTALPEAPVEQALTPPAELPGAEFQKGNKITLLLRGATIGALGVVFGDIGTSPLYAVKETFFGHHPLERTLPNVLGICSLIFWALMMEINVKYITFVLAANNKGEGGIFALLALLPRRALFVTMILFGAALFYGDCLITPAISVLSALEGIEVVAPQLHAFVLPLTIAVLIALFSIQSHGTARVGRWFGPIVLVWFLCLAAMGIPQIVRHPEVLRALNPLHALAFIRDNGWMTMFVLGSVVLCITGGEALYADMGHFGRRGITQAWLFIVYPALMLNYFGQGARLLQPGEIPDHNLFYSLVPPVLVLPMVVVATAATIIASQAMITGMFSLTQQAISLGVFPRMWVVHTSAEVRGQIYMPFMNWFLCFGCILMVLWFGDSSGLAAAYGIAVTGTMVVTTFAFSAVAYYRWKWPAPAVLLFLLVIGTVDITFFSSTTLKFFVGGYVPIALGIVLFFIMYVWQWGRQRAARGFASSPTLAHLTVEQMNLLRREAGHGLLPYPVVVLASRPITKISDNLPPPLDAFIHVWGGLPRRVIFFTMDPQDIPYVKDAERYQVTSLDDSGNTISVSADYGYMETPDVARDLDELNRRKMIKIPDNPSRWLILAGSERFISHPRNLLERIKLIVYRLLVKITPSAAHYMGLGHDHRLTIQSINLV